MAVIQNSHIRSIRIHSQISILYMRIAMIGQKGIPTLQGGIERHVEDLSTMLVKKGHQVFVYTRPYYTPKNRRLARQ